MSRYQKYDQILKYLQLSKSNIFDKKDLVFLDNIEIQAGHFKLNQFFGEHGLILYSLTNQFPKTEMFKHGKRLKNTTLLSSKINSSNKWLILDKFVHELLPSINNITLISQKRKNLAAGNYVIRIRSYFELDEIDPLVTERVMRRDIYFPMFINIKLNNKKIIKHLNNETYLRMLRLPLNF